jgi:hypothetical protein
MAVTSKWSLRTRILLLTSLPAFLMFVIMLAYHVLSVYTMPNRARPLLVKLWQHNWLQPLTLPLCRVILIHLVPQVDSILAQPGTTTVRILDTNKRVLFSKKNQTA